MALSKGQKIGIGIGSFVIVGGTIFLIVGSKNNWWKKEGTNPTVAPSSSPSTASTQSTWDKILGGVNAAVKVTDSATNAYDSYQSTKATASADGSGSKQGKLIVNNLGVVEKA